MPQYLPGFILRKREDVAALDIEILTYSEDHDAARRSIGRFQTSSSVGLSWEGANVLEMLEFDEEEDEMLVLVPAIRRHCGKDDKIIVFWGSLSMPAIRLPAELVITNIAEIVENGTTFWIYSMAERLVIEANVDGRVTVASIPDSISNST